LLDGLRFDLGFGLDLDLLFLLNFSDWFFFLSRLWLRSNWHTYDDFRFGSTTHINYILYVNNI
jgi:hypothetical protein